MKDLLSWLGRKGRYSRGQILGPLMLRSAHPHMLLSFASTDVSAANLELFGKSNVRCHNGRGRQRGQDEERRIRRLICPFNYQAELETARAAIDVNVGRFVSVNPTTSCRELAKQFHMSPATLCNIAKKYSGKRKPGPRSRGTRVVFRVRHKIGGKEVETAVAVTARKGISVESVRSRVARYYQTDDVSVVSGIKTERHAEYDYEQLEIVPRKS